MFFTLLLLKYIFRFSEIFNVCLSNFSLYNLKLQVALFHSKFYFQLRRVGKSWFKHFACVNFSLAIFRNFSTKLMHFVNSTSVIWGWIVFVSFIFEEEDPACVNFCHFLLQVTNSPQNWCILWIQLLSFWEEFFGRI